MNAASNIPNTNSMKSEVACETCLYGDAVVLVCGSYARREASAQSDIDFVMVFDGAEADPDLSQRVRSEIRSIVPNSPSEGGAFGEPVNRNEILANIGGDNDSNQNITHRILFLLEGEWLFNKEGLRGFRREILERYIGEGMTDHQLALFLLNDIIRYYRTVAVDYEFKISGNGTPKTLGNPEHQAGLLSEASLRERLVQHRHDGGSCTGRKGHNTGGLVQPSRDGANDGHMW